MRYRNATYCQNCETYYRTSLMDEPEAPCRCKHCKSTKTTLVENPEDHPQQFYCTLTSVGVEE